MQTVRKPILAVQNNSQYSKYIIKMKVNPSWTLKITRENKPDLPVLELCQQIAHIELSESEGGSRPELGETTVLRQGNDWNRTGYTFPHDQRDTL